MVLLVVGVVTCRPELIAFPKTVVPRGMIAKACRWSLLWSARIGILFSAMSFAHLAWVLDRTVVTASPL